MTRPARVITVTEARTVWAPKYRAGASVRSLAREAGVSDDYMGARLRKVGCRIRSNAAQSRITARRAALWPPTPGEERSLRMPLRLGVPPRTSLLARIWHRITGRAAA